MSVNSSPQGESHLWRIILDVHFRIILGWWVPMLLCSCFYTYIQMFEFYIWKMFLKVNSCKHRLQVNGVNTNTNGCSLKNTGATDPIEILIISIYKEIYTIYMYTMYTNIYNTVYTRINPRFYSGTRPSFGVWYCSGFWYYNTLVWAYDFQIFIHEIIEITKECV